MCDDTKFKAKPAGPRKRSSSDSLTVILAPWHGPRKPLMLDQIQTGRIVPVSGFYLCHISVMLLFLGLGLIFISVWSVVFKLNYVNLVDCSVELAYFLLPAAFLCFPCFWIALSVHSDEKTHRFLPLLIMLLSFSTMIMVGATYSGLVHRLRQPNESLRKEFGNRMRNSMTLYRSDNAIRRSWDRIQSKRKCCGVDDSADWTKQIKGLPDSCCDNKVCGLNQPLIRGCLDYILQDLAWVTAISGGLSCIGLSVQFCSLIVVTVIYFVDKQKGR